MSALICLGGTFDYDVKAERLIEVSRELELPDVWNEPERAQALGKERSALEEVVNTIVELETGCTDIEDLVELAVEESDQETFDDAVVEADALDKVLEKLYKCIIEGKIIDKNDLKLFGITDTTNIDTYCFFIIKSFTSNNFCTCTTNINYQSFL